MADYAIAGNFYLSGSGWAKLSENAQPDGQEIWENYITNLWQDAQVYFRNKYENPNLKHTNNYI